MNDVRPILLIVRPEGRCAADVARCDVAGWRGVVYPLLRLMPLTDALAVLPVQLADAAAVFWVSPSAVEMAAAQVDWSRDVPHVAVGQATAAALRAAGAITVVAAKQGNDSAAVLRLPLWGRLPEGAKVAIVRGENGRDELMNVLCEQGLQVACCDVYRRVVQQIDWPLAQGVLPDAVWVTSSELARLLLAKRLPEAWADWFYLTHHQRIADELRRLGVRQVRVLVGADDLPQALRERRFECRT